MRAIIYQLHEMARSATGWFSIHQSTVASKATMVFTLQPWNSSTNDPLETFFLFQRLPSATQRFNDVCCANPLDNTEMCQDLMNFHNF